VRQVSRDLAAGAVWCSACELYAHSAAARSVGPPDQVIRPLAVGQLPSLIGAYRTVCAILNAFEIPAPQTSQAR
jgi:hypothetical protein